MTADPAPGSAIEVWHGHVSPLARHPWPVIARPRRLHRRRTHRRPGLQASSWPPTTPSSLRPGRPRAASLAVRVLRPRPSVLRPAGARNPVHRRALHPPPEALDWGMVQPRRRATTTEAKVTSIAEQIVAMPMQGLFLSAKAVNICEDQMGCATRWTRSSGWHHFTRR